MRDDWYSGEINDLAVRDVDARTAAAALRTARKVRTHIILDDPPPKVWPPPAEDLAVTLAWWRKVQIRLRDGQHGATS